MLIPQPEGVSITGFQWVSDRYLVFFVYTVINLAVSSGNHDFGVARSIAYDTVTGESVLLMRDEGQYFNLTNIASLLADSPDTIAMELPTAGFVDWCYRASIYDVDLQTGDKELRERSSRDVDSVFLDPYGNVVAEHRNVCGTDDWQIWSRVGQRHLVFEGVFEVDRPRIWGVIDNFEAVAVTFPQGEHQGLKRLDLRSGEITDLQITASDSMDLSPLIDPHTQELVGFRHVEDLRVDTFIDEDLAELVRSLREALGSEQVYLTSWNVDRSRFTVEATNTGSPATYFLYDRQVGEVTLIASQRDHIASGELPRRLAFDYRARDGLEIHAYLTLPPGKSASDGPFPTVLMPHGGPQDRDDAHFDWWAAYYASLGYAVFQPNYRGSSGYGLQFEQAGYGEFGDAMVLDVLDGWRDLVARNLAQPDGFCAIGASYGGYSALMLGLHAPQEARCVAAVNGLTNPYAFISAGRNNDRFMGHWERYWSDRFGRLEERDRITPARRTADYQSPVLLIHGDEDITVPVGQSRLFRRAMGSQRDFRLVIMEGEDHYLRSEDARRTVLVETTRMLDEHFPVAD